MKRVILHPQPDGSTYVRIIDEQIIPSNVVTFTNHFEKFQVEWKQKEDGIGYEFEEKSLSGQPIASNLRLEQSLIEITTDDESIIQ